MRAVSAGVAVAAVSVAGLLGAGVAQAATAPSHITTTYRVHRGDTLSAIGTRLHKSWPAIAALNHITAPYTIYVGEVLKLPTSAPVAKPVVAKPVTHKPVVGKPGRTSKDVDTYKVRPGDSLWLIGLRNHVRWQTIASLNHLRAPYTIYPNEVLRLP